MRRELYYILVFISVIILQIFVFNNIEIAGFINPYVYIYMILILPIKINHIGLMVLAFILGGIIDCFSNTLGIHTFASTFIAFVRPYTLKLLTTQEDIDKFAPSLKYLGMSTFIKYALVLILFHHLILFLMEAFSFNILWFILLKTFLSSMISLLLIVLVEKLFVK